MAIYERIERSYQIKREEIPEKVETFHALQDLLGTSAKVMERFIAKEVGHALHEPLRLRRLAARLLRQRNLKLEFVASHGRWFC